VTNPGKYKEGLNTLYRFKSAICTIEDKYSSLEQFYIETLMRIMKTEIYHEKKK